MANGKVRTESHIIDQTAIRILQSKLPKEWVTRELTPDYGLDLEVEIFEKENDKIVTLGERLYIQVKGTSNANYRDIKIDVGGEKSLKRCLSFSLDTALLKLVERVGDSLPILLTVIDVNTNDAFCVNLNDYVNFVLGDDMGWRKQVTKTIYIPCENKIENYQLLRWYALRPKLNSFFSEAAALMIDVEYAITSEEYIQAVKKFALKHIESDVWNCHKLDFFFLDNVYRIMEDIINCRQCKEAEIMFRNFSENDLISNGVYENMPLLIAKQLFTSRQLIQELGNANSIFSSCIKQLFNITEYAAIVST